MLSNNNSISQPPASAEAFPNLFQAILTVLAGISCQPSSPLRRTSDDEKQPPKKVLADAASGTDDSRDSNTTDKTTEESRSAECSATSNTKGEATKRAPREDVDHENKSENDWNVQRGKLTTIMLDLATWENDFEKGGLRRVFSDGSVRLRLYVDATEHLLIRIGKNLATVTDIENPTSGIHPALLKAYSALKNSLQDAENASRKPAPSNGSFALVNPFITPALISEDTMEAIDILNDDVRALQAIDLAATLKLLEYAEKQNTKPQTQTIREAPDAMDTSKTRPFPCGRLWVSETNEDRRDSLGDMSQGLDRRPGITESHSVPEVRKLPRWVSSH